VLDETGFANLTVEAVAARAGAAKTAVYRRWPSKVPLVVDALIRAHAAPEAPDTGGLRTDMIALWHNAGGGLRSIERLLPVVTAYLTTDSEVMAQLRDNYFQPRLRALHNTVIARAVARGEIRADADPELAFDMLFAPLVYRLLRGDPPDDETIGRLTTLALQGLAAARPARGDDSPSRP
jgi:AcrR family transcriptional regulator